MMKISEVSKKPVLHSIYRSMVTTVYEHLSSITFECKSSQTIRNMKLLFFFNYSFIPVCYNNQSVRDRTKT